MAHRVAAVAAHLQSGGAADEPSYSVVLPEHLTPQGPWLVRRNAAFPDRLLDAFLPPADGVRTLYDVLEAAAAAHPHRPYLGRRTTHGGGGGTHGTNVTNGGGGGGAQQQQQQQQQQRPGPYAWSTYREVADARSAVGSGLLAAGVPAGAAVGLYGANAPEWVVVDAALHAYGLVCVPLYDTLGPDAVRYICGHAGLAAVAVAAAQLPALLEALPALPRVRLVVVWGAPPGARLPAAPAPAAAAGGGPPPPPARVVPLERLRAAGARAPAPHRPPAPADVALINYTSGTTGVPKGAVLTHRNLVANAAGAAAALGAALGPGDVHVSYLPLAHIYERFNLTLITHYGGGVGFYRGDVLQLLDDIEELKPTLFASVPRLWNRIHDKVMAQVAASPAPARALFRAAFASKLAALRRGDASGGRLAPLWDALVFAKVRAKVGGRVRVLSSGASPISPEVLDFLRVCFGAAVLEGYGMTESACLITLTPLGDAGGGGPSVGAPLPCCEVKLADLPEMGYTNADVPHPRGEVCVRGPTVFAGYHKDAAATAEAIDADGWLHTGDVGAWVAGGRLRIVDRKKNIFKLAQGEYVAPEKIENVYARSPLVAQAFVYGDSLKAALVAVVVPDAEALLPWAAGRGLDAKRGLAALCAEPRVAAGVLASMAEEARAAGLKGFEQAAAVHLAPEPFSVDNGLLTPTFKLKRQQAQRAFQAQIDAMYARLPQ